MWFPEYMTAEDILNFEYEYNKILDIERGEGQYWEANAELQIAAEEQKEN